MSLLYKNNTFMEDKLLTGDIWSEVNSLIKVFSSKKFAAISYISTNILNMIKGDILICDASLKAISTGQTSARALLSYHNTGVSIFSCDDLHSKLLLSEDFIITGSSNLSTHSRETLIEMAIFSESKSMINEAYTFFEKLKVIAKELSEAELSELLNVQIDIASYQKNSMNRLLFSQNLFHFTTKKGDYTIIKQEVRKKQVKYIYLELIKSSIIHFTNKTFIKHIYDKQAIDIWEAAINQNKQIFVFAEEETVNDLPNHYATKNKDKTFKTTLNVLILCDENKNRLEDPRKIAEDLLLRSGYFTLMK